MNLKIWTIDLKIRMLGQDELDEASRSSILNISQSRGIKETKKKPPESGVFISSYYFALTAGFDIVPLLRLHDCKVLEFT